MKNLAMTLTIYQIGWLAPEGANQLSGMEVDAYPPGGHGLVQSAQGNESRRVTRLMVRSLLGRTEGATCDSKLIIK